MALNCAGHRIHLMVRFKNTFAFASAVLACLVMGWFALAEQVTAKKNAPLAISFPADGKIDFEKHIQPIFAATCYECHSEKKIKGKLRLDSKELAMKGGSTSVAILPG